MNKNIKEIAEQAWVFANNQYDVPKPHIVRFQEKFAELIIQECLFEIESVSTGGYGRGTYDTGYDAGLEQAAKTIKEHFGIKE
jgi:hypothetical protein